MGPATITSTWLLHWHLSPSWQLWDKANGPSMLLLGQTAENHGPMVWWGGRGIQQDPPIAHHDLCCPPQLATGTRPHWGEANKTYTFLGSNSSHRAVCVGCSPRCCEDSNTPSEMSCCWTAEPSLSQSQALVVVSPKEILFLYYFYSSCPKFNKTTSKSLQVIAYIEDQGELSGKNRGKQPELWQEKNLVNNPSGK